MGVVDVQPSAVAENGIDQGAFGIGDPIALVAEPAGVTPRGLFLVGPLDPNPGAGIGVDDHRRAERRVELGVAADSDAVLDLRADDLADCHGQYLRFTGTALWRPARSCGSRNLPRRGSGRRRCARPSSRRSWPSRRGWSCWANPRARGTLA